MPDQRLQNAATLVNSAQHHRRAGALHVAINTLTAAIEIYSMLGNTGAHLATAYALRSNTRLQLLERLRQTSGVTLGATRDDTALVGRVLQDAQKAVQHAPHSAGSYRCAADAHRAFGRPAAADASLARAVEIERQQCAQPAPYSHLWMPTPPAPTPPALTLSAPTLSAPTHSFTRCKVR